MVVQQALVEENVYMWEGKQRTGSNLSCVLASHDEPSEYCIGQMRWTSKTDDKFKKAMQKLQNGLAFTMTKVSFIDDAKKEYIHSPIQIVLNLSDTHTVPVLNNQENASYPQTLATIADCLHLMSHQSFEVMVLVL